MHLTRRPDYSFDLRLSFQELAGLIFGDAATLAELERIQHYSIGQRLTPEGPPLDLPCSSRCSDLSPDDIVDDNLPLVLTGQGDYARGYTPGVRGHRRPDLGDERLNHRPLIHELIGGQAAAAIAEI